tara:strand:+ start:5653 stop:6468 length:816 start_codon:yes stop_codon:yes gene_type:complete
VNKHRAFLKWAGGKYKLVDAISSHLPHAKRLVEPFVGAGSVFLNTHFEQYLLCDINPDLIHLYQILQKNPDEYIARARRFFVDANNHKQTYYRHREHFNQCKDPFERSLYFLYFNRFGYNGLCRYNQSGGFNVPFGSYKKPYFPEKELWYFSEKSQKAEFRCIDYKEAFKQVRPTDVVYCDPPYAPLSQSANFTSYAHNTFDLDDQALLARTARICAQEKKVSVLVSNHDIELMRELYRGAKLSSIQVQRNISQNGRSRKKVAELFALYQA